MKLNYDCIRSVLLFVEEKTGLDDNLKVISVSNNEIFDGVYDFSKVDILSAIYCLTEAGYIEADFAYTGNNEFCYCFVSRLTWHGHELVEMIRNEVIWSDIKRVLTKIEAQSIELIYKAARKVIHKRLNDILI